DQSLRVLALRRKHTAVAGRRRGAGLPCCTRESNLGVVGDGAEAHAGDHDRYVQLYGLFGETAAEYRPCRALLAIPFQRDARQAARYKCQIVECSPGPRPQRTEAADTIAAKLGLDLNVFHDGR